MNKSSAESEFIVNAMLTTLDNNQRVAALMAFRITSAEHLKSMQGSFRRASRVVRHIIKLTRSASITDKSEQAAVFEIDQLRDVPRILDACVRAD